MARRLEFGEALDEDDVLVIQGAEYKMQPIGLRAMRHMLSASRDSTDPLERIDQAVELILASVRPEERDRLREHLEDRIGDPWLLVKISQSLLGQVADVDPTQPVSSSDGSPETGSTSTGGALPEVLTPSA